MIPRSWISNYWPCNESSGSRRDLVGGQTAADNNTVTGSFGRVYGTSSLYTIANTEYLSVPSNPIFQIGSKDFTKVFYFYITSHPAAPTGMAVQSTDDVATYEDDLYIGGNVKNLRWYVENASGGSAEIVGTSYGILPEVTPLMVILRRDRGNETISIQINNGPIDSTSLTGDIRVTTHALKFGTADGGGTWFNGTIGPIIFLPNKIVTLQEADWLWNRSMGRKLEDFPIRKRFKYDKANTVTGKPDQYYRMMHL